MYRFGLFVTSVLLAVLTANSADVDYTHGLFIINEDWYGHNNSSVNFLNPDDPDEFYWHYNVIKSENPGMELGCTNQFGTIYNGRFYFIAKQQKDPGASIIGGRITVADATSMKIIKQLEYINPADSESPSVGEAPNANYTDGRSFIGVNNDKGYVSSSNGVWILDLNSLEITGLINGTANETGSLYTGQYGSMEMSENHIFVANQNAGLFVIDPSSDTIVTTIDFKELGENASVGSVVKSKDGNIWVSITADTSGSGATLPYIVEVNPISFDKRIIRMSDEIYPPSNSWYAWTPDGFCASSLNNVLYWNGGGNSWFSSSKIYRYDIDSDEQTCIIDFSKEGTGWFMYGCSMRVDPSTDDLYISLCKGFSSTSYKLRRADSDGNTIKEYPMIDNYWFPSIPVFSQHNTNHIDQYIDNQAPDFVYIYSISGIPIAKTQYDEYIEHLNTLPHGIYLVKINHKVHKISI